MKVQLQFDVLYVLMCTPFFINAIDRCHFYYSIDHMLCLQFNFCIFIFRSSFLFVVVISENHPSEMPHNISTTTEKKQTKVTTEKGKLARVEREKKGLNKS